MIPVGRKIQEGLQLVVDPQDRYINLGERGQDHIQEAISREGRAMFKEAGIPMEYSLVISPFSFTRCFFPI